MSRNEHVERTVEAIISKLDGFIDGGTFSRSVPKSVSDVFDPAFAG